jgi:hypothetical protein
MSPTFEEYCRELRTEVDAIEQQAEADVRFDHLRAFNFGRSLGRMEQARDHLWLRVRWLLLGAAVGVAVAAVNLQVLLYARILQFTR